MESAKENAGLRGPVKEVISIDYEAINKFGNGEIMIRKPQYYGSSIQTYDSLGNIINEKEYYLDKCNISFEMFYDDKGNWTKWISYNDDEEKVISYQYEYNDKGDRIKEIDLLDGDIEIIEIKYNDKGQKTSSIERDDLFTTTYTYNYDGDNIVEETRTFKSRFYKSTDVTRYEYNEQNKLVGKVEYDNGKLSDKYEYDKNGNMVFHKEIEDGKTTYEFNKYDEVNRLQEYIKTNKENYANNDIIEKRKYYYTNDSTQTASRIQSWNENGELESDNRIIHFVLDNDTTAQVSLSKDNDINRISRDVKKDGEQYTSYKIESSHFETIYNYNEGKLVSQYCTNGNSINFEYNKNKLVKKTEKLKGGREVITLYKKGLELSSTSYDDNNVETSTLTFTYEGNKKNGKVMRIYTSKDGGHINTETTYKDGKVSTLKENDNIYEYSYNEQGDVIEIKATDGSVQKYEYKYDVFGNWVKRIYYNNNDITITERSIEYFQ